MNEPIRARRLLRGSLLVVLAASWAFFATVKVWPSFVGRPPESLLLAAVAVVEGATCVLLARRSTRQGALWLSCGLSLSFLIAGAEWLPWPLETPPRACGCLGPDVEIDSTTRLWIASMLLVVSSFLLERGTRRVASEGALRALSAER